MSGEIGFLMGMAAGDSENRAEAHAHDLSLMRKELAKKQGDAVYQQAFKEAAAAVQREIIDELAHAGVKNRRLSNPKNVDARNQAYAENAANAVHRISGGRMSMSRISIENARKVRALK